MHTIKCICGLSYSIHLHYIKCVCGHEFHNPIILNSTQTGSAWIPLHEYPKKHEHNWIPSEVIKWYWEQFVPTIPCGFCTQHWFRWVEENPLEEAVITPSSFFEWGWRGHNWVSKNRSNKPTISLQKALELWWPPANTTQKKDVK